MVFSSLEFLFLFLPFALALICAAPRRLRIASIFFVSLVFYAWGGAAYLPLMLAVIAVNYALGLLIGRAKKRKRLWLAVAVIFDLSVLAFFKYADFALENLSFLGLSPLGLELPIGISFYVFQILSYVIDVYRGEVAPQKDPLIFGSYVTLFPQLIAGPIVKYRDVENQLKESKRPPLFMIASGVRTFVCGLSKKVLLANVAGELWQGIASLSGEDRTAVISWLGLVLFALQIYFDFSGYSDMAIGLGKMLGFRFLENFNYPYVADSITDFWRRWHISLSGWFREYLYIPLGGNRCGRGRVYFNLLAVWLATGIWHGAGWNFLIWGLYYFLLIAAEKAFLGRLLKRLPRPITVAYSLFFVLVGWLIFAFDSTEQGLSYLLGMLGVSGGLAISADLYEILRNLVFLLIAAIACTPIPRRLFYRFYERSRAADALSLALCALGFALCVIYLVNSSYNPFLYFRF